MKLLLALLMVLAGMGTALGHSEDMCPPNSHTPLTETKDALTKCEDWGTSNAIAECLYKVERKDGAELAAVYNKIVKGRAFLSSRAFIKRMRKSQRAWLEYQKTQCNMKLKETWGEPGVKLNKFAHARCLTLSTKRRLWELLEYVSDASHWYTP